MRQWRLEREGAVREGGKPQPNYGPNFNMGLIIMMWPFLKYWGLVISILMWVDMFLGEMFLGRAPNTLFWERIFWQTLGVALS